MSQTYTSLTGALQYLYLPYFWDDILYGKQTRTISTTPAGGQAHLMTDFNEQRLLEGLQKLDSQSIGAIYDRYFPEIYR